MILKVAKSIDEYLEIITQIKSETPIVWYRGQPLGRYLRQFLFYI